MVLSSSIYDDSLYIGILIILDYMAPNNCEQEPFKVILLLPYHWMNTCDVYSQFKNSIRIVKYFQGNYHLIVVSLNFHSLEIIVLIIIMRFNIGKIEGR